MNNGQIELSIVKGATSGVFVCTEKGVEIASDTSFEQWKEGLKFIKWAKTKLAMGLADYISFGEARWPDKVPAALEQLEFEATMVKAAVAIKGVPVELRLPGLDGEHFLEIAKLDRTKQFHWAQIASNQRLTPTQLRLSIAEGEVIDRAATKSLSTGVVTIHGIRQQFDVWFKRVGGVDGIMKMEQDVIDEIQGELQAMVQLGVDLQNRLAAVEAQ